MIISQIRSLIQQLTARFLVKFAPTSSQSKARYKRYFEAVVKASYKKGTQLDRRIAKLEDLIEQLEAEADRLSEMADKANLLNFRAQALLRSL